MRWESLVSVQNLRLAWRRINTGRNIQHKRFFRDFYLVYETALDKNLKLLRQRLVNKAWRPRHPERIYIPKPSGLQRPLTLLGIEDQIMLQAITNLVSKKLAPKRKKVELDTVFSNILSTPNDSIFFLRPWQESYGEFQKRCEVLFNQGNEWIGHFDLAAYYDTISHDLLCQIVSPKNAYPATWGRVKEWLKIWSAADSKSETAHGIPQGPIASDFLAEAFFLPIDLELSKRGIPFVRYVDDIRLFGKSENSVREAGIVLERLARDRGLIPQGKKFGISRAKNVEEAMGSLPSIPPTEEEDEPAGMTEAEASELLESCVGGRPLRVTDKTRFRFLMYRAPHSTQILKQVLRLLPRHPEHIDAFVAYLGNYAKGRKIATEIFKLLESGIPYTYVRGELWHILARLEQTNHLSSTISLAREDAKRRSDCVALSWGVMNFMIRCDTAGVSKLGKRLQGEAPFSRALLCSRIPDREFAPGRVIPAMLRGTLEEQLSAARQLQVSSVTLSQLKLRQRGLSDVCQHSLRALGVIRRVHSTDKDWIKERLAGKIGLTTSAVWRKLLGTEYEHALQILIEADAMFEMSPSNWLGLQDNFNEVVLRQFVKYLKARGLPGGAQALKEKSNRLVDYGVLVGSNSKITRAQPTICAELRTVHSRRNLIPGSHPYEKKGGSKARFLTGKGRDALLMNLKKALGDIATFVVGNP